MRESITEASLPSRMEATGGVLIASVKELFTHC
jgi:hypothetical protein